MEAQAKIEDREHDANRVGGPDLAIVLAFLCPDAVLVRERGGAGTSIMRRDPDGSWYFVD
jgi:ketosteroid isomerase-like protein